MNNNNKLATRLNSVPSLIRNFDLMFDDLFSGFPFANPLGWQNHHISKEGSFVKTVDVPGLNEGDLQVKVEDGLVTVSGESKTETSYRSVNHSFSVPENFDLETLSATLQNGVLTLEVKALPTLPHKEPKVIPVLTPKDDVAKLKD